MFGLRIICWVQLNIDEDLQLSERATTELCKLLSAPFK